MAAKFDIYRLITALLKFLKEPIKHPVTGVPMGKDAYVVQDLMGLLYFMGDIGTRFDQDDALQDLVKHLMKMHIVKPLRSGDGIKFDKDKLRDWVKRNFNRLVFTRHEYRVLCAKKENENSERMYGDF